MTTVKASAALQATAYHEAGHAAMALWHQIGLRRATIQADASTATAGLVHHEAVLRLADLKALEFGAVTPQKERRAQKLIMVSFAGPLAQRKFNPRSLRSWHG